MICSCEGIKLTKAQLTALLEFASKDSEQPTLYGVHFVIHEHECRARATDGHRAVQVIGQSDGEHPDGQWFVSRDFLDRGKKVLDADQSLRLPFSGASLLEAKIEPTDADVEIGSYAWPQDACRQQVLNIDQFMVLPSHRNATRCVTLLAQYLSSLAVVAKATAAGLLDCYPPKDPTGPFIAHTGEHEGTAEWMVIIMPQTISGAKREKAA